MDPKPAAPSIYYMVVPGEPWYTQLATLRALCQPDTRDRPHITVQALHQPLPQHELARLSGLIRGKSCTVHGCGTFWKGDTQHTVYLEVDCPALQPLGYSPTYSEYIPHMTMYDGPDREVAKKVAKALRKAKLRITFSLEGLERWQSQEPSLRSQLDLPRLSDEDRWKAIVNPQIVTAARLQRLATTRLADSTGALQTEMGGAGDHGSSESHILDEQTTPDTTDSDAAAHITETLLSLDYRKGDGQTPGTFHEEVFGGERTEWVVAVAPSRRVTLEVSRAGMNSTYTVNQRSVESLDDALAALQEAVPAYAPEDGEL